jgi:hypothetical protein
LAAGFLATGLAAATLPTGFLAAGLAAGFGAAFLASVFFLSAIFFSYNYRLFAVVELYHIT